MASHTNAWTGRRQAAETVPARQVNSNYLFHEIVIFPKVSLKTWFKNTILVTYIHSP